MTYHGFAVGQRVRIGQGWCYGVVTGVKETGPGQYVFWVKIGSGHQECPPSELRAVRRVRKANNNEGEHDHAELKNRMDGSHV